MYSKSHRKIGLELYRLFPILRYKSDLDAMCIMKQREFEDRQKLRAGELDAITQAIELLGDGKISCDHPGD
jgi:hypothetical protein